jgi:hypothetical protein
LQAIANSCWQQDAAHNRTAYQALDGGGEPRCFRALRLVFVCTMLDAIAEGQMFDYDRNIVYVLGNNQCEYHCNIADVSGTR